MRNIKGFKIVDIAMVHCLWIARFRLPGLHYVLRLLIRILIRRKKKMMIAGLPDCWIAQIAPDDGKKKKRYSTMAVYIIYSIL